VTLLEGPLVHVSGTAQTLRVALANRDPVVGVLCDTVGQGLDWRIAGVDGPVLAVFACFFLDTFLARPLALSKCGCSQLTSTVGNIRFFALESKTAAALPDTLELIIEANSNVGREHAVL